RHLRRLPPGGRAVGRACGVPARRQPRQREPAGGAGRHGAAAGRGQSAPRRRLCLPLGHGDRRPCRGSFRHDLTQRGVRSCRRVPLDRWHSGPLDIAATQGILGLAALSWVLVVLALRAWRHRLDRDVAALSAALVGYTVWVVFNFDWSPATGAFWLLAGTLWSAQAPPHSWGPRAAAHGGGGARGIHPWRPGVAVVLVAAALVFDVF